MAKKNKIRVDFRFHTETISQLDFLAEKLERNRTDIAELAINYLCDTYRKKTESYAPLSHRLMVSEIVEQFSKK
jgi:hypothetical protein